MTKLGAWLLYKLQKGAATFLSVSIASVLAAIGAEGAGAVEIGEAGVNILESHIWITGLSTGVIAAVFKVFIPALAEATEKLDSAEEVEL